MSVGVTGRRYARRASVRRIRFTQSGPDVGSQMSACLRTTGAVAGLYGPATSTNSGKMFRLVSSATLQRNRLQRHVVHELGAEGVLVAGEEQPDFVHGPLRRASLLVDGADLDRHADGLHRLAVDLDDERDRGIVGAAMSLDADPDGVVGVVLEDGLQLDRAVADLARPVAPGEDAGLRQRTAADGARGDLLGRGQVLLHQRGRDRQHVADVVESVAGIVGQGTRRWRGSRRRAGRGSCSRTRRGSAGASARARDPASCSGPPARAPPRRTRSSPRARGPRAALRRAGGISPVLSLSTISSQVSGFAASDAGSENMREVQSGVGLLLVMAAGADLVEHGAHVAIEDGRDRGLGVAGRPGRDEAQRRARAAAPPATFSRGFRP